MLSFVTTSAGASAGVLHNTEQLLRRSVTAQSKGTTQPGNLLAGTISMAEPLPSASDTVSTKITDATDDLLVDSVLAGDDAAFAVLVERHSRRVMTIARHFFRQQDTVEDISQETFAKAYLSLQSYRRGASFAHWLSKIAVNNCYDELRRRKKRNESLLSEVSEQESVWLEMALAPRSFERHNQGEERKQANEMAELLLDHLSPEDRLVLVLLHAEELSVREIAALTGWSEAKVKIRAFRARQAARRHMSRLLKKRLSDR